jgi:hypothetical protein
LLLLVVSSNSTDPSSIIIFAIAILPIASSSHLAVDAHIIDTFYERTIQPQLIYAFIVIVGFAMLIIAPHRFISLLRVHDSSLLLFTSLSSLSPL